VHVGVVYGVNVTLVSMGMASCIVCFHSRFCRCALQVLIESRLPSQLTEHLNSEIVLRSIRDIESMLSWASSTFFSVRAKKVPAKYFPQLKSVGGADASSQVDRLIRDLMVPSLNPSTPTPKS
jgi:hypothetical protein